MYCNNCGNQIDDNAVVCIHCGAPTQNAMQQQQFQQPAKSNESNTLAIVGFVLAFFMPLIGLICSAIGLKRSKELGGNQKGLAIAGIVISSIEIFVTIVVLIACGSAIIAAFSAMGA